MDIYISLVRLCTVYRMGFRVFLALLLPLHLVLLSGYQFWSCQSLLLLLPRDGTTSYCVIGKSRRFLYPPAAAADDATTTSTSCTRRGRMSSISQRQRENNNFRQHIRMHQSKRDKSSSSSITASPSDNNNKNKTPAPASHHYSWTWLWKLCFPLWLVYVSNQWSRSSLYYLVDFSNTAQPTQAMNVAIGFDQVQYGLLASVAFTSLFAVASLGAGIAADRFNRKVLTVLSAMSWSLATLGTAVANSFEIVLLCRIAMGLACAFSTPTAYTLIRERVPSDRVALASSLYGTGVAMASGLASLTILLDSAVGWRYALDIVSGFGIAAALVTAFVVDDDDPKNNNLDGDSVVADKGEEKQRNPLSEIVSDVSDVVSTSRVKWIFFGSFLRFCSGLCIGVWSAPYFRQVFIENQSEYAVAQAFISAALASLSGLIGGASADWLASRADQQGVKDFVGRRLWVPVVGSVLAAPTWFFAMQMDLSFQAAMIWLGAEYFVAECWFGPTISTLQSTVGPKVGGTAQGLFTLTGAVANLAPSVVGFLYGQQGTASELSQILQVSVCFGYLSSAICFMLAAQSPPPNVKEKV